MCKKNKNIYIFLQNNGGPMFKIKKKNQFEKTKISK